MSNTKDLLLQYSWTVAVHHDTCDLCHVPDLVIPAVCHSNRAEQRDAENGIHFMKLLCDNNPVIKF